MKKLVIVVAFGAVLAGCNQQAVADLAMCKADLTKAQTELTGVQAAADQKVAALDAQLKQAQDQLATYQSAADAAAAAAAKRAGKVAVVKKAVKEGATEVSKPIQQITDKAAKVKAKR